MPCALAVVDDLSSQTIASALKTFLLGQNLLTGPIPSELSMLSNLLELSFRKWHCAMSDAV